MNCISAELQYDIDHLTIDDSSVVKVDLCNRNVRHSCLFEIFVNLVDRDGQHVELLLILKECRACSIRHEATILQGTSCRLFPKTSTTVCLSNFEVTP